MANVHTTTKLESLPIAFYDANGTVDVELFRDLLLADGRNSKDLKTFLGNSRAKTYDARLLELATKAEDPSFRQTWYEKNQPVRIAALFYLVINYTKKKNQRLSFSNAEVDLYFSRTGGKSYPRIEKIDEFVDFLFSVPVAPRDAALYAWSWMENCTFSLQTQTTNIALTQFRGVFRDTILRRGASGIRDCLEPGPWKEPSAYLREVPSLKLDISTATESRQNSPVILEPSPRLKESERLIKLACERYEVFSARMNELMQCIKQLQSSPSPVDQLHALNVSAINGHSLAVEIEDISTQAYRLLIVECNAVMGGWSGSPVQILPFPPFLDFDKWKDSATLIIANISQMANIVARLELHDSEALLPLQKQALSFKPESFDSAIEYLLGLENIARNNALLQSQYDFAVEKISEKCLDICWKPWQSGILDQMDWDALTAQTINSKPWSLLSALLVRSNFASFGNAFIEISLSKFECEGVSSVLQLVSTFSTFALNQLDQIARVNSKFEVICALSQFQRLCITNGDTAMDDEYWHSWPLSQYIQSTDALGEVDAVGKFFSALHSELKYVGKSDLLSTLFDANSQAVTKYYSILDTANDEYRFEILEILRFRNHGAGAYAALWRAAHQQLFEPHYNSLLQGNIDAAVLEMEQAFAVADVDAGFVTWERSLYSSSRESQHEKATKIYVTARVGEVLAWCKNYRKRAKDRSLPRPLLVDAIVTIRASNQIESRIVGEWLKSFVDSQYWKMEDASRSELTRINFSVISPRPTQPRAFLNYLQGIAIDWNSLLGDELSNLACKLTLNDYVEMYRSVSSMEGLEALCRTVTDSDAVTLVEEISRESAMHALKTAIKFADLKARIVNCGRLLENDALLVEFGNYLANRQWTRFDLNIVLLEAAVEDAERVLEISQLKQKMVSEIVDLGDSIKDVNDFSLVEKQHAISISRSLLRKKHISPISDFRTIPFLRSDLSALATEAENVLGVYKYLPTEQDAEFLHDAYTLVLGSLAAQLRRSSTLLPEYRQMLEAVGRWFLLQLIENSGLSNESSLFLEKCILVGSALADTCTFVELVDRLQAIDSTAFAEIGLVSPPLQQTSLGDFGIARPVGVPEPRQSENESQDFEEYYLEVRQLLSIWLAELVNSRQLNGTDAELGEAIKSRNWERGISIALCLLDKRDNKIGEIQDEVILAGGIICGFAITSKAPDLEVALASWILIDRNFDSPAVRSVMNGKGDITWAGNLFFSLYSVLLNEPVSVAKGDQRSALGGLIRELENRISRTAVTPLSKHWASLTKFDLFKPTTSRMLKLMWEFFSGDKLQAEIRCGILTGLWKLKLYHSLVECLTFSPIEIEERVAVGYVGLLKRAEVESIPEAVENLRRASTARPFLLFSEKVLAELTPQLGVPATFKFVAPLEKTLEKAWVGILQIVPRALNPPLDIEMELAGSSASAALVGGRALFCGPFFSPVEVELPLALSFSEGRRISLNFKCKITNVDNSVVYLEVLLDAEIIGADAYVQVSQSTIEDAFNSFPSRHMRGAEFVARPNDERKIEKILFSGKETGSLWLASPRRAGKTSMLFRILDSYSHAAKRDNAVLYFTLTRRFESVEDFISWIWARLRSGQDNEIFRNLFDDFARIGEDLPFDGGVNDFIVAFVGAVKKKIPTFSRIYFIFDEVDKFVEMLFAGARMAATVDDIMWQLRHVTSSSNEIGFVFSGSALARRHFVENSTSAFYNGISTMHLTPFSSDTPIDNRNSREIALPERLHGKFTMPDATLKHLIWVTAGIPYYMKIAAGAMYSVAKQSYLLSSDVDKGLKAIFDKNTGIARLDSLDNPGEDELRTLYVSSEQQRILAKAVLYAVAEIRSPMAKAGVKVGELAGPNSILATRFRLNRKFIDQGLQLCIDLGYLQYGAASDLKFAIPILGESIRARIGLLWTHIHGGLESMEENR